MRRRRCVRQPCGTVRQPCDTVRQPCDTVRQPSGSERQPCGTVRRPAGDAVLARLFAGAALALALLSHAAAADVVFRVPEVLVRHTAVPRAVGTGGSGSGGGGTGGSGSDSGVGSGGDHVSLRYEEYFVEHEVSTPDARRAAARLDVDSIPAELEGCGACSARERQYCVLRALHDHCCCERRAREPFPWLPHSCYAGPRPCRPLAPDCAAYARTRDCCCLHHMAEHWKNIMVGGAERVGGGAAMLLAMAAVALAAAV